MKSRLHNNYVCIPCCFSSFIRAVWSLSTVFINKNAKTVLNFGKDKWLYLHVCAVTTNYIPIEVAINIFLQTLADVRETLTSTRRVMLSPMVHCIYLICWQQTLKNLTLDHFQLHMKEWQKNSGEDIFSLNANMKQNSSFFFFNILILIFVPFHWIYLGDTGYQNSTGFRCTILLHIICTLYCVFYYPQSSLLPSPITLLYPSLPPLLASPHPEVTRLL